MNLGSTMAPSSGVNGVLMHRDVETFERPEVFVGPDQIEAGQGTSHVHLVASQLPHK
jgi:hypothetical protein